MKRLLVTVVAACLFINLYLTYSIQTGKKTTDATQNMATNMQQYRDKIAAEFMIDTTIAQSKKPNASSASFS
ncbi:MAG: hypothetical protein UU47_C0022G0014 [candidate division TM6 bacterium GW2011_GWE2_41_16]|nr:MAG: hypothetical protein UU47_C0022G0014 [candidate division TM6 bacterium GW2011_GWE2_41_16]